MLKAIIICLVFTLISCDNSIDYPEIPVLDPSILVQLTKNYTQLPERKISVSRDSSTYAQYTNPTSKYTHGILGDAIEAEQLVVVKDSVFIELDLDDSYVFEDIRPRLFDVDQDGDLEIITIRTHIDLGAAIMIYKIVQDTLQEYAFTEEIGISNKWLNLVTIHDLTNDGQIEIAWVETPHIGGRLKYTVINEGKLEPIDEIGEYSNHAIGESNLCLSALTEKNSKKVFYIPNQERTKIVGFTIEDDSFQQIEEIDFSVDFSETLKDQYPFPTLVEEVEDNCIH